MTKDDFNIALRAYTKTHLSPTASERGFVSSVYQALQDALGEAKCLRIGSYPRFTAVTPLHDLDVLYILGSWEGSASTASTALQQLEGAIRTSYQNPTRYSLKISRQTHSITFAFLEGDEEVFAIDVVPAYIEGENEFGDDTYVVPEIFSKGHAAKMRLYEELAKSRKQMTWIRSDPRGYIEVARLVNGENGDFRKAVKFVKAWKEACCEVDETFKLKSFHLEQLVTRLFQEDENLTIFDALFGFFCDLPGRLVTAQIPDRAEPKRMIDAYVNELTMAERTAILQARDFFLIRLERFESGDDIATLLEGGRYRRKSPAERYLFDDGIPVLVDEDLDFRIQGSVLPRDGFRPFTLDAVGLIPVDMRIRFGIARSVPADLFKWKVKNDDRSPQPRGEITDHRTQSDPESTKYKGKHFVECYAIQDGICIARARQNVELRNGL